MLRDEMMGRISAREFHEWMLIENIDRSSPDKIQNQSAETPEDILAMMDGFNARK